MTAFHAAIVIRYISFFLGAVWIGLFCMMVRSSVTDESGRKFNALLKLCNLCTVLLGAALVAYCTLLSTR